MELINLLYKKKIGGNGLGAKRLGLGGETTRGPKRGRNDQGGKILGAKRLVTSLFKDNLPAAQTCFKTIAHFLLNCTTLEIIRQLILRDIKHILRDCAVDLTDSKTLLQLIIDCTAVLDIKTVRKVISHIRRLCFALHIERYKRLSLVPYRKRSKKTLLTFYGTSILYISGSRGSP